jgi:hypothetical protein
MAEINGYTFSRAWFAFVAENRELIKPTHTALFFWIVELWNRLGQPNSFGLPTSEAQHHSCISSHTTFSGAIVDLTAWGFLTINHKSKNQYTANIVSICLPKNWQSNLKAKAKHVTQHHTKQLNGIVDIIEPLEPLKKIRAVFKKPTWREVAIYIFDKLEGKHPDKNKIATQANSFVDYYESKGWVVGKTPMKNWQAAANRWITDKDLTTLPQKETKYLGEDA